MWCWQVGEIVLAVHPCSLSCSRKSFECWAAITSQFHTMLQLVYLSNLSIWLPCCTPADVPSLAWFIVISWQFSETCEVRYSSIMTIDTLQLHNFRKDVSRRNCLLGADILLRTFPNLAFPNAITWWWRSIVCRSITVCEIFPLLCFVPEVVAGMYDKTLGDCHIPWSRELTFVQFQPSLFGDLCSFSVSKDWNWGASHSKPRFERSCPGGRKLLSVSPTVWRSQVLLFHQ